MENPHSHRNWLNGSMGFAVPVQRWIGSLSRCRCSANMGSVELTAQSESIRTPMSSTGSSPTLLKLLAVLREVMFGALTRLARAPNETACSPSAAATAA